MIETKILEPEKEATEDEKKEDSLIIALGRSALGQKTVLRFFPDVADPEDPLGDVRKFDLFLQRSLHWLACQTPIILEVDEKIPTTGILYLESINDGRVLKILSVGQGGRIYFEPRHTFIQGGTVCTGSWIVRNDIFYAFGFPETKDAFQTSSGLSRWKCVRELEPGPALFRCYGVPEEKDLTNEMHKQALVDYFVSLCLQDIASRILRPKKITFEGIPKVQHAAEDYNRESIKRMKRAQDIIMRSYVSAR